MAEDLWSSLLQEALRTKNRAPDGTVICVGPKGCGKNALVRRLLGAPFAGEFLHKEGGAPSSESGAASEGDSPLSYAYFDAVDASEADAERDDSPAHVSIWGCSEMEFEPLLATVLRPESLAHTLVLLTLDLSAPWTYMETLDKWSMAMERRIASLAQRLPKHEYEALKDRLEARLRRAYAGPAADDEGALPELPEGVLATNWGVPVVVVGLKADLQQSDTFEERQRLLFAQQRLRRFCLKYGAALVYTSAKDSRNCRDLHRYLLHRLYPNAFPAPSLSSETGSAATPVASAGAANSSSNGSSDALGDGARIGDSPFIPDGWDTLPLISAVLPPGNAPWKPDAPFDSVIKPPASLSSSAAAAATAAAEMDVLRPEQQWLAEMEKHGRVEGGGTSAKAAGGSDGASPTSKSGAGRGGAAAAAGAAPEANPDVLASFFQGLLKSGKQ